MFAISIRWVPTIVLVGAPLAFTLWAVIDAACQPGEAWDRTRHRQWVSIVACLFFVGYFFEGIGIVLPFGATYYATIRPTLIRAKRVGRVSAPSPPGPPPETV